MKVPARSRYEDSIEIIEDQQRVVDILNRIKDARALLTINIPNYREFYSSALLNIDSPEQALFLDELYPRAGHKQLLATGKFFVLARLKGVEIRFASILHQVVKSDHDGLAMYKVALPLKIRYGQRRSAYRALVGRSTHVPIILRRDEENVVEGRVTDLSTTGVGAELERIYKVTVCEIIPYCKIILPQVYIVTDLEVRFGVLDERVRRVRVGGKFCNLEVSEKRAIQRLVAELDRQSIRTKPLD